MGRLCNKCINREPIKKGKKPGNDDHGVVTEEIPPLSHIYGSQWYNLNLTSNGNPSSEDMAKAKKAQEEARADIIAAVSAKAVKKRTFKVAATVAAPVQAPEPVQAQVQAPVQAPVSNTQIVDFLNTNPNLSDADIAGLLEFLSQQKSLPLR